MKEGKEKEVSLQTSVVDVVENFYAFEEVEEIITASNAGTIGCCL